MCSKKDQTLCGPALAVLALDGKRSNRERSQRKARPTRQSREPESVRQIKGRSWTIF